MNKAKLLSVGTGTLLLFIGIGATIGGLGAILDPSGEGMGVSTDLLESSPFTDFLIPGMVLFCVNGLASFIVSFLSFKKHPNAGIATMVLGMAMIVWITAQVYWIGWQIWLQPIFLVIGVLEIALGYLIERRHDEKEKMFDKHRGKPAH